MRDLFPPRTISSAAARARAAASDAEAVASRIERDAAWARWEARSAIVLHAVYNSAVRAARAAADASWVAAGAAARAGSLGAAIAEMDDARMARADVRSAEDGLRLGLDALSAI